MYAYREMLTLTDPQVLRLKQPLPVSKGRRVEVVILVTDEVTTPPYSLQVKDLNRFFAELPELGEDAASFAQDIQTLRKLPVEVDAWD